MSLNKESDIQVSVCVVTYNQEKYIAECLESLVTQQTSFKFEIIVGEDCSTDNTRKIIQQYVEQYPDLIVPLFYEENVGAVENVKRVYKAAKGKYIAHMDGDDMALPNKLQRQFDILEQNDDCNVCSHDMININLDSENLVNTWVYPEKKYDLLDLYKKMPFFAHSSKMFRNKYSSLFWDKLLNESYILDIDVHIENLIDGDIYHIGEFLGKYRLSSGVSHANQKVNPALPLGAVRVFEKGLTLFKNDNKKIEELRGVYALAMLQCAYNYAIYDKDKELFSMYVKKSIDQKIIGWKSILFILASMFPFIFFKLFSIRNSYKENRV